MEFNIGWFTGCVLHYDEQAEATLIKFHVNSTTFHVKDKLHTFSLHPPTQRHPAPPPVCYHIIYVIPAPVIFEAPMLALVQEGVPVSKVGEQVALPNRCQFNQGLYQAYRLVIFR